MSARNVVLIVDDEEMLLETIAYNLEKSGLVTFKAADGESGLFLALGEKPQLIILDVMLPRLSGWEVCRTLRKSAEFRHDTPILMLSARSSPSDKAKSIAAGADDHMVKPFAMKELMERVKLLLEKSEQGEAKD